MVEFDIPQDEADELIAMCKVRENDIQYRFPGLGGEIRIPLLSEDKRINFHLDIGRGRIDLNKIKYQNRVHQIIILVRLDTSDKPHMNPDGIVIAGPHLHRYREGYGTKWATELPTDIFPTFTDRWELLRSFLDYCNIIDPPIILAGIE